MRAILLLLLYHKLEYELQWRLHKPPVILICRPLVYCSTSSCSSRPQRTQKTVPALISKTESWLDCYFAQLSLFLIVLFPEQRRQILEQRPSEGRDQIILSLTFTAAVVTRSRRRATSTHYNTLAAPQIQVLAPAFPCEVNTTKQGRSYVVASGGGGHLKKGLTLPHLII